MTEFVNPYNFIPFEEGGADRNGKWDDAGNLSGWMDVLLTPKTSLIITDGIPRDMHWKEIPEKERQKDRHYYYKFYRLPDKKTIAIPGSSLRGMIRSVYEAASNSCVPFVLNDSDYSFSLRTPVYASYKKRGLIHYSFAQKQWELYEADEYKIDDDIYNGIKEDKLRYGRYYPITANLQRFYFCGQRVKFKLAMNGKKPKAVLDKKGDCTGWLQFNVPVAIKAKDNTAEKDYYHVRVLVPKKDRNGIKSPICIWRTGDPGNPLSDLRGALDDTINNKNKQSIKFITDAHRSLRAMMMAASGYDKLISWLDEELKGDYKKQAALVSYKKGEGKDSYSKDLDKWMIMALDSAKSGEDIFVPVWYLDVQRYQLYGDTKVDRPDQKDGFIRYDSGSQTLMLFGKDSKSNSNILINTWNGKSAVNVYEELEREKQRISHERLTEKPASPEQAKTCETGAIAVKYTDKVYYLSGSSIGRVHMRRSWKEIMGTYAPCADPMKLCPACLLFGTVNAEGLRGRLRFTDAIPKYDVQNLTVKHLPVLASPRVSAFEFYLRKPLNATYWNYDYYSTGNNDNAVYRDLKEASPRGRKMYWHSDVPQQIEVDENNEQDKRNKLTKMKATMEALEPGEHNCFRFRVYFDNITEFELKALEWVLTFGDNSLSSTLQHKLGHARPLGYGSVKLTIEKITLREVMWEKDKLSYKTKPCPENAQTGKVTETTRQSSPWKEPDRIEPERIRALLAMSDRNSTSGKTVEYPLTGDNGKIFEWFAQNRTNGTEIAILPEPSSEKITLTREKEQVSNESTGIQDSGNQRTPQIAYSVAYTESPSESKELTEGESYEGSHWTNSRFSSSDIFYLTVKGKEYLVKPKGKKPKDKKFRFKVDKKEKHPSWNFEYYEIEILK